MIKFSIKIDDDNHSLTKEDGIDLSKIGELLQNLHEAIDNGAESKCTLGQIRGNCYALDFYTKDEGLYNNFITVHKNIEQVDVDDLPTEQKKYANTLKTILGDKYFLTAYDNDSKEIAAISEINEKKFIKFYYTTDTIYGVLSELGSGSRLASSKKHIYINGTTYKIYLSKDQDLKLKDYYGTQKLRVEVKQKRSSTDGHVISSELESFVPINSSNLSQSLSNEGYIDFALIKDTNSIEDILNRIYANR